jgi:hypothetical protein
MDCGSQNAHAIEKPLILVSVFKFISANFDNKLLSTVYLLVLFVASIATAIYSPVAGYLYEHHWFCRHLPDSGCDCRILYPRQSPLRCEMPGR